MRELGLDLALVATTGAYALGVRRSWSAGHTSWAEPACFLAGMVIVAVALVSPIDAEAHRLIWVHMVQHMLLVAVAAPLLAWGRPVAMVLGTWCPPWQRWPHPGRWATIAAVAAVQVVVLVGWHIPALFDAALAHDPLHAAEHVTLLVSAVALWSSLERVVGDGAGLNLLVVFGVSFPPLLLGAAMTFATTPWYDGYDITDQQLAGVVMWAYGGLAALAAALYQFARWLHRLEAEAPGRPELGAGWWS